MKWIESARPGSRSLTVMMLMLALTLAAPVFAAETVRIFRSTMPDGSVVLGDSPSAGAREVVSRSYAVPLPSSAAEAERDYWRRQSEAFDFRQRQRDLARDRHDGTLATRGQAATIEESWQPSSYVDARYAGRPLVPRRHVPRKYTSSPGAARGRSSGFIGSGFSSAR